MAIAAILLGLGSLGGLVLLALRLRGGNPPIGLAMGHGLLVGAGLVTLIVVAISGHATGAPIVAAAAFVVAGGIGAWLVSQHLRGRVIPIAGVLLHGMFALFGWAAMLGYYLG